MSNRLPIVDNIVVAYYGIGRKSVGELDDERPWTSKMWQGSCDHGPASLVYRFTSLGCWYKPLMDGSMV